MPTVSVFPKGDSKIPTETTDIAEVVRRIREGDYKTKVEEIRTLYQSTLNEYPNRTVKVAITAAKKAVGHLKLALPAVTFSGVFSKRNDNSLTQYSGHICIDIDNIASRIGGAIDAVIDDPSVVSVFRSPTDAGIKVVYRIPSDPSLHKAAFWTISTKLKDQHNLDVDQKAKSLSQLCFVSYDPDVYFNPNAVEITIADVVDTRTADKRGDKPTPPKALKARRKLAEEMFGDVDWVDDRSGFIECPGKDKHTTPDGHRDCRVFIDGVANIQCFHDSCKEEVKEASDKLWQAVLDAEAPEVYYEVWTKNFWITDDHSKWITMHEGGIRDELIHKGFRDTPPKNGGLSQVRGKMRRIRRQDNVALATPLAGHRKGVLRCGAGTVLVTNSPSVIEPVEGEWWLINSILENLFAKGQQFDQRPIVYGWLKRGYEAVRSGQFLFGQALAIAGEKNCGKNLFQDKIITPILGGRCAKPYRYMRGGSEFNADLFAAEHLVLQDETAVKDFRSRRDLGAKIKDLVVNQTHSLHAKGKDALVLPPIWRLSISLNDGAEDLQMLPPLEESIGDKIILLRATRHPWPIANVTQQEQREFDEQIRSELPAFCHFLETFEVPDDLQDSRFGVISYHHPELAAELSSLSPEEDLLDILDNYLLHDPEKPNSTDTEPWKGKLTELKEILTMNECGAKVAATFLRNQNTLAINLGKLADTHPDRVRKCRTNTGRWWEIAHKDNPFPTEKSA